MLFMLGTCITHGCSRVHACSLVMCHVFRVSCLPQRLHCIAVFCPLRPPESLHASQALHAFELALSLEKLNYNKLWALDDIASKSEDYELASYVEEILQMQVTRLERSVLCGYSPSLRCRSFLGPLLLHVYLTATPAVLQPAEGYQDVVSVHISMQALC